MVKASVIITSYNNSHNLEKCLKSLIKQDYNRSLIDAEIIVVDSGSTDNSIEILNGYKDKIKVVTEPQHLPRLSPAMARNTGVQNSIGDVLIFSDSDCIFPLNWVKNMATSLEDPRIDCVIGNREPDVGQGLGTFIRRYDFILYSNKFTISEPLLINEKTLRGGESFIPLSGNNFAIRREVWNKLGGMRTVFKHPAGEDIMLEVELIKNGYNILFNPQSKVIHVHPISLTKVFQKAFPRSEATYLLSKYSNGFVNWRHFAERGHILNIKNFFIGLLFVILFLLIVFLSSISASLALFILLSTVILMLIIQLIKTKKRLELILSAKEEEYKKDYRLSLFKLFCFLQIHFLLKILALINFSFCLLKDKYAFNKKTVNN